jgi:NTE family protein
LSSSSNAPKIGLALGSGASRGWSHIGVLKALLAAGIEPDVVCGTSVGAMVGASYAAGNLNTLEEWVLGSNRGDVLSFFNFKLARTAFVDIERLNWFLHSFVAAEEVQISELGKTYAAVCTNLANGEEVWLTEGAVSDAVRASMAMPGLFPAEHHGDRWLVDGGLVNPVPVSTCRALGADIVIAVNLNSDILTRRNTRPVHPVRPEHPQESAHEDGFLKSLKRQTQEYSNSLFPSENHEEKPPGLFSTIAMSINIFQDQITRARHNADPADVIISPKVGDIRMLDFQRADAAIREGNACAQAALPEIFRRVGMQ